MNNDHKMVEMAPGGFGDFIGGFGEIITSTEGVPYGVP